MKVFFDTNILLDFLLRRGSFFGPAARLLTRVESRQVEAYVSAISFNNVFYLARKTVGADAAREMLRDLRRLFDIVPLDHTIIDQAIGLTVRDFEDAIQAVSAARVVTPYIVTRNARDFEGTGVKGLLPEEMLVLIDSPKQDAQ